MNLHPKTNEWYCSAFLNRQCYPSITASLGAKCKWRLVYCIPVLCITQTRTYTYAQESLTINFEVVIQWITPCALARVQDISEVWYLLRKHLHDPLLWWIPLIENIALTKNFLSNRFELQDRNGGKFNNVMNKEFSGRIGYLLHYSLHYHIAEDRTSHHYTPGAQKNVFTISHIYLLWSL